MIGRLTGTLEKWGEFVKFSHTIFAMPFALASMAIAARENRGWPGLKIFALIILAMVFARTCAMAFNRIADREFDAMNPRTSDRHLPAGRISLFSAWTLCIGSGAAFIGTCYFINMPCFYLSLPALFIICFYSLTKRFTHFTHVFLGISLALAPIGAWLAVRGGIGVTPVLLALIVVGWLMGFDVIYAVPDYKFDKRHGLHSAVVKWGIEGAFSFAFIVHLVTWGLMVLFGLYCGFKVAYFSGMLIILLSLLLEHFLARRRKLKWINLAFFRLNALISVVFVVVVFVEVMFPKFWYR
ncbi:MAG: putative 4-hydroxybenzoate polyprenyltransferase [Verrucomicrobia bacterium]|nr:putative 4-hydroxybenzoate polyprenyltransferase [Verrucomicrobiota bacterium]